MQQTIVVVPCYNEAQRLDRVAFLDFVRHVPDVDILFVNDGSNDNTLAVLEEIRGCAADRFRVLDLPQNVGKAEAVRRGLLEAFARRPAYVGYWDADLATPLDAIVDFCRRLEEHGQAQVIIGSRVALLGRQIVRKWSRHLLGRIFATCASWVLGVPVYDTQCGAKMMRASAAMETVFAEPFCSRWIFDVEILARILHQVHEGNWPAATEIIYELPLDRWHDVNGSKLKRSDFAKATVELWTIFRKYRSYQRRRKPVGTLAVHTSPQVFAEPQADLQKSPESSRDARKAA